MIKINEARIMPEGDCMIIDVQIHNLEYYDNVYLDSITIDTQDTYIHNGPSQNPIYHNELGGLENKIYSVPEHKNCNPVETEEDNKYCFTQKDIEKGYKSIRLVLNKQDLLNTDLNNNMFFIYITAKGTLSPNTPCGYDTNKIMIALVNLYPIFHKSVCLLKQLNNRCDIPKELIQFILQVKAIDIAIKAGQYPIALEHWKILKGKNSIKNNKCNCNGKY